MSAQVTNILGYLPEEVRGNWQQLLTDHPMNQRGIELTQKAIDTGIAQEPYHPGTAAPRTEDMSGSRCARRRL